MHEAKKLSSVLTHAVSHSCTSIVLASCWLLFCFMTDDVPDRFPRFITIRSDRRPEDASTPEVIVDLYNKQSRRMTNAAEMLASKNQSKSVVGDATTGASDQEDDGGPDVDAIDN